MTDCTTIRPGDPVFCCADGRMTKHVVERITKLYVVVQGFSGKFRRKDGREVGAGTWHWCDIVPVTEESKARYMNLREMEKQHRERDLLRTMAADRSLPIEKVRQCLALLGSKEEPHP